MRNKILSILIAVVTMLSMVTTAKSSVLWEQNFGKFKIFAWSGEFQYCAIKTYWRSGEEFSLRYNSVDGLHLVITTNHIEPEQKVGVWFDGRIYGAYEAYRGPVDNQLVSFIMRPAEARFMDKFMSSYSMEVRGQSGLVLGMDLEGTRILGENLYSCAKRYGF